MSEIKSFEVSKKNPHYFKVNGKETLLIHAGHSGAKVQGGMGVNVVTVGVMPWGKKTPYRGGEGASVNNNWNGWDEKYWSEFKANIKRSQKAGRIFIAIWESTCYRKSGKGTWDNHLWNIVRGGPIDAKNGVKPFYSMGSNQPIYGTREYSPFMTWQEKNQYRQEQLVDKILSILNKYPNTGILLTWEVYDQFNERWATHMVSYMRSLSRIPIGMGTPLEKQIMAVRKRTGISVFGFQEGAPLSHFLFHGKRADDQLGLGKYPMLMAGYHPQPEVTRYRAKDKQAKCVALLPGEEKKNIVSACRNMAESVTVGGNTSYLFKIWLTENTDYFKRDCLEKYPEMVHYDTGFVISEIKKFGRKFAGKVAGIDWSREPGNVVAPGWCDDIIPKYEEKKKPQPELKPKPKEEGKEEKIKPAPPEMVGPVKEKEMSNIEYWRHLARTWPARWWHKLIAIPAGLLVAILIQAGVASWWWMPIASITLAFIDGIVERRKRKEDKVKYRFLKSDGSEGEILEPYAKTPTCPDE